nr:DUF3500 domain-containing protein [Metabacillus niabensis]
MLRERSQLQRSISFSGTAHTWSAEKKNVLSESTTNFCLLDAYLSEDALEETYIGWAGSSDYNEIGSYVRMDGPRYMAQLLLYIVCIGDRHLQRLFLPFLNLYFLLDKRLGDSQ